MQQCGHVQLDSPEHKSKMMFNIGVSKKRPTDRDDGVKVFDPDYKAMDMLLEAAGLSPSRFEQIGFKLFQHRLMKTRANADMSNLRVK